MATVPYSTRSILPWQDYPLPLTPESYRLPIGESPAAGEPKLIAYMYRTMDGIWCISLYSVSPVRQLLDLRGQYGYKRPRAAEKALMGAISRALAGKL